MVKIGLKEKGVSYAEMEISDGVKAANFQDLDGHGIEVVSKGFL